jgi:hypothetical protein
MVSDRELALLEPGLLRSWWAADKRLTQCYRSCRLQKLYMLSQAEKQRIRSRRKAVAGTGGGGTRGCEFAERQGGQRTT